MRIGETIARDTETWQRHSAAALGNGPRAREKTPHMHSLPIFLRLADRPVILVGAGETADAKRRLLERAGARVIGEDGSAAIAIVAIDDDIEAAATIGRLKRRGVLVNAVDRPADCDFTLPAIVDRTPVLIAIGTGGASAGLAKALRQRLEALFPTGLGGLALALGQARAAMRARWPDAAGRRRAIDAALSHGAALDPLGAGSAAAVDAWLAAPDAAGEAARMIEIHLASPDPDDLSLRQARLLGQADRLFHRPDVPASILDRARADAARLPATAPPASPGAGLSLFLTMETA